MEKRSTKDSRVSLIVAMMIITFAVFIVRLFYIQIISHAKYTEMAYKEQVKKLTIPAKRGLIYAMDGTTPTPVVLNTTVYKMFIDPVVVKNQGAVKAALFELAPNNVLQPDKLDDKFAKTGSRYQIVADNLTREQAKGLKEKRLSGVGFQEVSKRVYPEGTLASQVLGFVNAEGGQYGVEGGLNDRLSGQDGLLESVTDIAQVPLTIGEQNTHIPAKDGDNIVLTLDKNIQAYVEKIVLESVDRFGADEISVLVINPNNNSIMALANYPSFDPSEYQKVSDVSLFNNRVTMVPYEPGSVIKTLTMAMGLNENIITPTTTFYNTDRVKVADRQVVNAIKGHTGNVTMQDAMRYSLNTGMIEILSRAGGGQINSKSINLLYKYFYDDFGLGQQTGIEIPEVSGIVVPPTSHEGNAVRYSNMAFGQGMNVTMLQTAAAFAGVINEGKYYRPTIVGGVIDSNGEFQSAMSSEPARQIVTPETSYTLRKMVSEVRSSDSTGWSDPAGFEIGGKTGTSETLRDGKYIKTQTIASYLGYGGGVRPEYVIMVQVGAKDRYMVGGAVAAPIFNEISNWLIQYLKIPPKE
ncbi:MAG: peptidoglycan D,D-transpeptidase FtsI family protein [Candidatus Nanosyncoccaceae bacterium]|jgi:cell division protein FtsI/penicillin-binding protein 2